MTMYAGLDVGGKKPAVHVAAEPSVGVKPHTR